MRLSKYSIGTGDRFTRQARAQLKACMQAMEKGVEVIPVWNKSNREHILIGSEPGSARHAADDAVRALDWGKQYFCDADHTTLQTVDRFLETCDFYTIDVADSIGQLTTPVNVGICGTPPRTAAAGAIGRGGGILRDYERRPQEHRAEVPGCRDESGGGLPEDRE
ncbi:MAG TPA: hypothetical protein VMQ17_02240 [Candidatus Sulfotelmatobacter sp.]|nr:hypothetical protein [Candidatus Sulfotelmatobacter sp.]